MGLAISVGPSSIDVSEDKDMIQSNILLLITNEMMYDIEKIDHCVSILSSCTVLDLMYIYYKKYVCCINVYSS
jgi:hypothetical protein